MKVGDVFQLSTYSHDDPASAWKIVLVQRIYELVGYGQIISVANNLGPAAGYFQSETRNIYATGEVINE